VTCSAHAYHVQHVNDAPALAAADAGIAFGPAADLARGTADITILRDDLQEVVRLVDLSRRTFRIVKQNLAWAFGYNSVGIVIAAFGFLRPVVAAAAMVRSSLFVVANSMRLRRTAAAQGSRAGGPPSALIAEDFLRPAGLSANARTIKPREVIELLNETADRAPVMANRVELALAEWREFNFSERTWTIPDAHAKGGKGHVLPLSDWAIQELQKLKVLADGSRYVLPNADKSAPADPKYITRGVSRCLKRFQKHGVVAFTPHDLLRTGRTGLARLGVKVDIAERVLNHARERIEATYDLHEYIGAKREALEKWANYLCDLRGSPAVIK